MGRRCNLVCCPHCGYHIVDESRSRVANWLRRLWPAGHKPAPPPEPRPRPSLLPLNHIPPGRTVEVADVSGLSPERLARLSVFGLVPGERVEVLQHRPAPIIRLGQTELTLSQEILSQIRVRA
ncbi:MAG: ferrous iron transport protein A [Caldilineae bacterium]|nr:MAG: ferrous iron transport protein A [Caldilineae bacterium]